MARALTPVPPIPTAHCPCPGSYVITIIDPPASEPVSLAEALFLRVDHEAEDD